MVDVMIFGKDKVKLQALIEWGKIEFVEEAEELSKYECVCCNTLALYNYTPSCKHIYCGKCHGKIFGRSCFVKECQENIIQGMPNVKLDHDIANLQVYCAYKISGCSEKIALHNYLDHKSKCSKNLRKLLPKLYREDALTAYKERTNEEINSLQAKLTAMEKQLLEMQINKDIKEEVRKISERLEKNLHPITERLSLDLNLQKEELQRFKSEVIKTIDGKISDLFERQAIKANNQMQTIEKLETDTQREMAKEKIIRSEEKMMQLVDKKFTALKKTPEVQETMATEFEWTIAGISKILKDWSSGSFGEILSESFVTKAFAYKLQCKLVYQAKKKAFSIMLKCEPNYPRSSPPIYLHQRIFSVLDQSRNGENHITRIDTPGFGNTTAREWMSGYHNDSWPIEVELIGKKYIKNDSIAVKILIEPLAIVYKSVYSKNGKLTWQLTGYRQKKKDYLDGVTKFLRSPYFYTRENGYRVHLGLHVRSWYASFYLSFDRGEFDDSLSETFPHQATLTIIAQSSLKSHENLTHSQRSTDTTSNLVAMIPIYQLESSQYLKDDSFLITLTVE